VKADESGKASDQYFHVGRYYTISGD
jgi:hypothetical protein